MRKLELSPYYPPRARWYSPLFRVVDGMGRILWLDRIHRPDQNTLLSFITALIIPGYAFHLRRERLIARAVMAAYALLGLGFVIWIGYPAANIAFGLMLSLHVTSILFLCNPWLSDVSLLLRLLAGVGLLITVGGLVYAPVLSQIQGRWLMPMRVQDQVVIVQTFSSPQSVKRGDWVAYSIEADGQHGLLLQAGLGIGPVLAVAGDHVQFTPAACAVNGIPHPRRPRMPDIGSLTVPENHWFIWPDLTISSRGDISPANVDAFLLKLANVKKSRFVGKPFQQWFWRDQNLK